MNLTSAQFDLALVAMGTALMWVPYTVALMVRGGVMAAMGNRDGAPKLPRWAQRAKRAHANAVENLAVFAPLLILGMLATPNAAMLATAARVYLGARLAHYLVYVAGIPVVRTLAFIAGWGATIAVVATILS